MKDPYKTPRSDVSNSSNTDLSLEEYWVHLKSRRNSFYAYLIFVLISKPLLWLLMEILVDDSFTIEILFTSMSVMYLLGLIWFGYRVTNIRCYDCGYKLATGHFFKLRNVRCLGCGFKNDGT